MSGPSLSPSVAPDGQSEPEARRRYPVAPVVAVAVAVFREAIDGAETVSRAGAAVLLVRRKNPPRAGEWGLPGGRLHLGEHSTVAVARELWEECNIRARLGDVVDTFEPIVYDNDGRVEYHYVVIEFWAQYIEGEALAGDDAAEVAWCPVAQLAVWGLRADSIRIIEKSYHAWQNRPVTAAGHNRD